MMQASMQTTNARFIEPPHCPPNIDWWTGRTMPPPTTESPERTSEKDGILLIEEATSYTRPPGVMTTSRADSGDRTLAPSSVDGERFVFGPYTLDTRARRLLREGTVVPLKTKAFDTLEVLLRAAGQTVSKDDLLR